eukprot:g6084.t1
MTRFLVWRGPTPDFTAPAGYFISVIEKCLGPLIFTGVGDVSTVIIFVFIDMGMNYFQFQYLLSQLLKDTRKAMEKYDVPHITHTGPSPVKPLAPGRSLDFLVVGDFGRMGSYEQLNTAAEMALAADQTDAPFVISTGDNIYPMGVTSVNDPQFLESWKTVYTDPALQRQWYMVLGNHDARGNCDAQIEYAQKDPVWYMPSRYYSVTLRAPGGGDVLLVFLETNSFVKAAYVAKHPEMKPCLDGGDPVSKQLAWLNRTLAAAGPQTTKIVVGHHPVYSGGKHADTPELQVLVPIFQRHGVLAYLCGHDHNMQHIARDGLQYLVSGAGSKVRGVSKELGTKFASAESGFLFVSLLPPSARSGDGGGSGEEAAAAASGTAATARATTARFNFVDMRGNLVWEWEK